MKFKDSDKDVYKKKAAPNASAMRETPVDMGAMGYNRHTPAETLPGTDSMTDITYGLKTLANGSVHNLHPEEGAHSMPHSEGDVHRTPPPPPPLPLGAVIPWSQRVQEPSSTAGKKKVVTLLKQQGGNYMYYSSFSLALQKLGINHYNNIKNIDEFIVEWKKFQKKMRSGSDPVGHEKLEEIKEDFVKIDAEWDSYKKPGSNVKETFRGDQEVIKDTYPWLPPFMEEIESGSQAQPHTKEMDLEIQAPIIMSTSVDPKNVGYILKKTFMWHFDLEEGHAGVTEGLYQSEGEVTFPLYNRIKITSLQYIPKNASYMDDAERFGDSHRYIIRAKILPRQ